MAGLVVPDKAERARQYHHKTVHVALEITSALGYDSPARITGRDVLRRVAGHGLRNFDEIYPWITVTKGALVRGDAPPALQLLWEGKDSHKQYMWENA